MKIKKLVTLILALILATASFAACDNSQSSDGGKKDYMSSDWEVIPENTNQTFKYFGFFHCDGFLSQTSYMEEIAELGCTNIFMINSATNNETLIEKLALAKKLGHKIVLSLHGFFEGGIITQANSARLIKNPTGFWDEKRAVLQNYIDDGTIFAFYFDEPAWNGIKEADFQFVTKLLRDTCPNTRVMTTMTTYDIGITKRTGYPEINASYNRYCTDVMYDSYAAWNDETRRTYLEALKSKATENQYIWGCATGFVKNAEQNGELYSALKGIYTEAIQEPRYAGIVSFSYADGFEGDWGYGMHTFLNNSSAYYDRELRNLYVDIGRKIIGAPAVDHATDTDIIIVEPSEVYEIGETVSLPAAGATDGLGNELAIEYSITSPSGKQMPVGEFVAEESGLYVIGVTADNKGVKKTRNINIAVRTADEISLFDSAAYLADAGGGKDSVWCWPRSIDTSFKRSGTGSLKVMPHSKDGTWPKIVFNRNGYELWDMSEYDYISMWVYNPSSSPIEGFAMIISDEDFNKEKTVYNTVTLPAGVWTEVKTTKEHIAAYASGLDLSKITIAYGNCAAGYENRTTFYIDDVKFGKN